MKNLIKRSGNVLLLSLFLMTIGCNEESEIKTTDDNVMLKSGTQCSAQTEETDYVYYPMNSDGSRVGDVMPYYDSSSQQFYIYYLKNVWNDATNQRHPWYCFTSSNLYQYTELSAGQVLACSTDTCAQDYAIGTGSVIKYNNLYYAFYTGHNPNSSSSCFTTKEGIMLATSSSLNSAFSKVTSFSTIYAPTGQSFDTADNFRDPYVFYDGSTYYMLVSARKTISGTTRGVIIYYTSSNLLSWTYGGVLYTGGSTVYSMMECPQIFKISSTYYLIFSEPDTKHILYRKSSSVTGTWSSPSGTERFDGTGLYSAKIVTDGTDNYIFGWTANTSDNTDSGTTLWGGNMVVHKLYAKSNGDLAVCIPHTLKGNVESDTVSLTVNSTWGNVTKTDSNAESYHIISTASWDVNNVLYEPISNERYMISATVSYSSSTRDFGFLIGACDGYDNVYSLRFVPSQSRFSFDKTNRTSLTSSTTATNDVPFTMSANTNYKIQVVVENSMVIVYINNEAALSSRIYKATNTTWGIFVDNSNAIFSNVLVTTN